MGREPGSPDSKAGCRKWGCSRRRRGRAGDPQRRGDSPEAALRAQQPVDKVTRRSSGDASRLNHVASRRSSLRFGRNTPGPVLPVGAPPSRALSAGRLAPTGRTGRSRRSRHFIHRLLRNSWPASLRTIATPRRTWVRPRAPKRGGPQSADLGEDRSSLLLTPGSIHRVAADPARRETSRPSPASGGRCRCEAPIGRTGRRSLASGAIRMVGVPAE